MDTFIIRYAAAYLAMLAAGWIVLRWQVRRDYLRQGRLSGLGMLLQAGLFFAYGGFPALYLAKDWPAVQVPWLLHGTGLALIGTGLGFLLLGMMRLGVRQSLGREARGVTQTGLYARTRNPQSLACGLYVVGFVMLWPSWYAAGWAILYGVLIHLMILEEEAHLRRQHGESYERYCRQVPRYWQLGARRNKSS